MANEIRGRVNKHQSLVVGYGNRPIATSVREFTKIVNMSKDSKEYKNLGNLSSHVGYYSG